MITKTTNNLLKSVIPVWRNWIQRSTLIGLDSIINTNSFTRSDSNVLKNEKTLLERSRIDNLIFFNLTTNGVNFGDISNEETKVNILYNCNLELDFYGEETNEIILKAYGHLFLSENLRNFEQNFIGIKKDIQVSTGYETINGVRWLRGNMKIPFTYFSEQYVDKNLDQVIEEYDINIKEINNG